MEQSFCGQYDAALFFWTKFTGNPALNCTEVRFYRILSDGNNWLLLRFNLAKSFYNVKNRSSIITSKSLSKDLSNENKY